MINTSYETLFEVMFGDLERTRRVLQAAVPTLLLEAFDWSTLTRHPGSFLDRAARDQHIDQLYSVAWRNGGEALLYLLSAHPFKPTSEYTMQFRILISQTKIWDRWRKVEHRRQEDWKNRALPEIVPIVVHRGNAPSEQASFEVLVDMQSLILVHNLGPAAKDALGTTGRQLIEQGRQQGAQGVLLRMLRRRFGAEVDAHVEQRVAAASVERIETWSERVLSAAMLAELFDA